MSASTIDLQKMTGPLHGIESLAEPIPCPVRIESGIWKPPSYMVRLMLSLAEFKVGWPGDKVTWTSYMRYGGTAFEVRDWKRSTWTIEADSEAAAALEVAAELKKKLCNACAILDHELVRLRKEEVDSGQFFLDNSYLKVRNAYEHFKAELLAKRTIPEGTSNLGDRLNAAMRDMEARTYSGCAAVAFYFSALETILDIGYALGSQGVSYAEFRALPWQERMAHSLPVGSDAELGKIHGRLLRVKREIRDRVLHGLGGEQSILLPTPGIGLIPVSYQGTDPLSMISSVPLSEDTLQDVPSAFDDFDAWLASHEPWCEYVLLGESMLPIPLFGKRREEILKAMGDDFEDWIHEQQEYQDYLLNDYSW
jgi:hypothetical protein